MQVNFYQLYKRINSTKRPDSDPVTFECQLKQPCGVLNPTLILSSDGTIVNYNYAYIPAWKKYYFVSDTTVNTGGRYEISLTCDELASWKESIGRYTCFVERAASSYNALIADPLLSNTENNVTQTFTSTELPAPFEMETGCFLLRAVNNGSSLSGIETYLLTQSQLGDVLDYMFTDSNFSDVLSDTAVKAVFNPFQYIAGITWLPLNPVSFFQIPEAQKDVIIGWWNTGVQANALSKDGVTVNINDITMPSNAYSDWRAYNSSFTQYQLYLPGVGIVNLAPAEVHSGLSIQIEVDALTGATNYFVHGGADIGEPIIGSYSGNLGVNIQIGQLSGLMSSALGVTSKAGSDMLGKIINWTEGAAAAVLSHVNTAFDTTESINGSVSQKYLIEVHKYIVVTLYNRGSADYPTAAAGRPLMSNVTLSGLSGYVKCGNASIDIGGYDGEKTTVNGYLNGGFYYE